MDDCCEDKTVLACKVELTSREEVAGFSLRCGMLHEGSVYMYSVSVSTQFEDSMAFRSQ